MHFSRDFLDFNPFSEFTCALMCVLNILQAQTRLQTGVAVNMGTEQKPVCIVCSICTWLLL
jgi:hypothetical protein